MFPGQVQVSYLGVGWRLFSVSCGDSLSHWDLHFLDAGRYWARLLEFQIPNGSWYRLYISCSTSIVQDRLIFFSINFFFLSELFDMLIQLKNWLE